LTRRYFAAQRKSEEGMLQILSVSTYFERAMRMGLSTCAMAQELEQLDSMAREFAVEQPMGQMVELLKALVMRA
jgi:hypothetical protein